MERYVYARPVLRAEGYQYFYIDAESREDADRRIKKEGEFQGDDIEVVPLAILNSLIQNLRGAQRSLRNTGRHSEVELCLCIVFWLIVAAALLASVVGWHGLAMVLLGVIALAVVVSLVVFFALSWGSNQ